MAGIIDFILIQGGKGFGELPFCPVDAAVLCQLSYLKFEYVKAGETLLDTLRDGGRARLFEDSRFGDDQRRLLFEAAFSPRYQNMRIKSVHSVRDEGSDACFCAMIFEPEGCESVVVFRGTDEYVVGWKEDFAMAYKSPVPSQTLAAEYLARETAGIGDFFVCGHSKGGNLARYAALHAAEDVRSRIKMVYDLDGPGFSSEGSLPDIGDLGGKITPRLSLVGRLFQSDAAAIRVDSDGPAVLQHDIFNWKTDEHGDFIYLDGGIDGFRPLTARLNANVAQLSPEQLERFVEALFGVLKDADVNNLADFGKHWLRNSKKILSAYIDLDDKTREVLTDTLSELILG